MYKHINDNKLLIPNQSGFCQGDSTVNQLLYITHQIYTAFKNTQHVKFVLCSLIFLKHSIKFSMMALFIKLKTYGITGPLLLLIESYLLSHPQRMVNLQTGLL